jgi:alkaline phosphatase
VTLNTESPSRTLRPGKLRLSKLEYGLEMASASPPSLRGLITSLLLAGILFGLLAYVQPADAVPTHPSPIGSLADESRADHATPGRAHAILLFIGDGMGESHRTAARWKAVGLSGSLAMDTMPFSGWSRTSSANSPVTDSAAAATALATGVKTNNGVIGQDPDGNDLITILERARAKGMSVGLVTTTQMAHATPAAFATHVPDRGMMTEIARQMLAAEVNVLLGGGEDDFLPVTVNGCYPEPGKRTDGRNLVDEAVAQGYVYVCDADSLAAVDPTSTDRLLGLFADGGLSRPFSPTLAAMTQKAIGILSRDPEGFFLMVEGGQIDWASHSNDAVDAISDTIWLDEAIAAGQTYALNTDDVLLIATADHETGGMGTGLVPTGLPGEDGPFAMPDGTPFWVNWTTSQHTAADVPTTVQGRWSILLADRFENTAIHEMMRVAITAPLGHVVYLPFVRRESLPAPGY